MLKRLNADNAREAMVAKGFTQTALANLLDVSKEAVSQWLKNKSFPRPNKLLQLGKLLGLGLNDLVVKDEPNAPVVAFRKMKGTKTKDHHIEKAQEMGRFLGHLVPFLPFDTLEVPPTLKSPVCEYEYLEKVAEKVRFDINVEPQAIVDFPHLIRRFSELHAVVVPVLWGSKQRHENAVHIYLPESGTTWVYLNLDTNVHDFKFWMAHELGHCLSPSLTGTEDAEDFADAFAGALLFPRAKAELAYAAVLAKGSDPTRIACLIDIAKTELISPYTIYKQLNCYAKFTGKATLELDNGFFGAISKFNKGYKSLSEVLFGNLRELSSKDFIQRSEEAFETPFFKVLGGYLKETGKGAGFVQAITDMPLLDTRSIYTELT